MAGGLSLMKIIRRQNISISQGSAGDVILRLDNSDEWEIMMNVGMLSHVPTKTS